MSVQAGAGGEQAHAGCLSLTNFPRNILTELTNFMDFSAEGRIPAGTRPDTSPDTRPDTQTLAQTLVLTRPSPVFQPLKKHEREHEHEHDHDHDHDHHPNKRPGPQPISVRAATFRGHSKISVPPSS